MADNRAQDLIDLGNRQFTKKLPLLTLLQEIAENFYVERSDFTGEHTLGEDFADHLMDSFPELMRRELGNSISAMLRPRDRPWFRASTNDDDLDSDEEAARYLEYLSNVQRRKMYDTRTQFIRATKEADHDFVTFGQAVMSIEESADREHLFYRTHHIRDCVWLENKMGVIDHLHRKDKLTARVMREEFGAAKVHESVLQAGEKEPDKEFEVRHIVMPSEEYDFIQEDGTKKNGRKKLPFVSIYVDVSNSTILREGYLPVFQYCVPRWHTIPGWQYAFSPATVIALPDGRLAQQMTRILLESGEKSIDPPMLAKQEAIKEANIQAGAITWADIAYDEKLDDAFQLLTFQGDMRTGFAMRADLREMLTKAFYLDKLTLPPPASGEQMTATEVARRLEEFVRNALPLFEPMEIEYNASLLDKTFALLTNMNVFDFKNMPEILRNAEFTWAFESPIQEASKRMAANQFAEALQITAQAAEAGGVIAQGGQTVPVNLDHGLRDALAAVVPAKWMKTIDEMAAEAEQAQEAQEAQQTATEIGGVAEVAGQVGEAAGKLRDGLSVIQGGKAA